ncbi:MAG: 30S ribosomal protein S7 [Ignavibacteria bacterium GWA2_55_11]|nr:MAG: 30S ribosomal protein S7 [Ignavibacteria bacterium GWA2_55_11]OGU43467.1 MAG: 30S ribosomal protein S7 [Ignavibacteria bacterium GWC2_56_12]OGU64998.1 MAG: 30S ribosomal protein S7 [Ignavibacteria bacterium RIFCSPHIGHO2_02_FULL_56_12]OGU71881.1 MAG: 30S ribosomal protein S7 [Ignavibacteria bacterium RIFCSPLOWO2_12_FULL_56_21]OGU74648.1 MAG: 30S ribosomal protein S7 [Ignavibacteria bacterium RIFCSPLOWO2_02_FULL_55_14]HAV24010.1 30S ribosomal protein S7 [Bacteroidota bacterium]
MRKKRSSRRRIAPDPKYNDLLVARFINNLLKQGKKNTARGIMYEALTSIASKTEKNPVDVFRKAVDNASPLIEVRARRVGGATYQVPTEVRPERRTALAIRWLISNAKERSEKSMSQKLAAELLAASTGEGGAIKKKDDVHRMAEANKAFAHFRW